jgi:hypothetical protein
MAWPVYCLKPFIRTQPPKAFEAKAFHFLMLSHCIFFNFRYFLRKRIKEKPMETIDTEILKKIIQNTDSGLILFFVILAVVAVPVCLLLQKQFKYRQEAECRRREHDRKSKEIFIQVITSNTEIMTGLKATLDANNAALLHTVERIHNRLDGQNETLQLICGAILKPKRTTRPKGE